MNQGVDQKTPGFDFVTPFRYLFDNPDAGMNLLLASVSMLIPVVGPIVLLGWQGRILRALTLGKKPEVPRFDFNQFVEYLKEGLLPFVINLLIVLPIVLVGIILAVLGAMGITFLTGQSRPPESFLIASFVMAGGLLFFVLILVISIFTLSGMTRAFLTCDWGQTFEIGKIISYAKATWKSVLVVMLVLIPASFLILVVGMLALYVGIYPASILLNLAGIHLMGQIYRRYLEGGGEAIPVKAD